MAFELVALLDRVHAGRRAGIDEIAGAERHQAREIVDRLGDAPDELRDVALLADLAIHLEPDRALADMADLLHRRNRRAGCRLVEAFAHVPGPAHLLGLAL